MMIERLRDISDDTGGIITTRAASENGVSRSILSRLCKQGVLERIAQGQYIFPNELEDELLSISLRLDNSVFSHETALYLQGLSDRVPYINSLTSPSDCVPPKAIIEGCKVYYIKPELILLGKTSIATPAGNMVPAYDIDRTICDVIRSRNRVGTETFLHAIKAYAASPDKHLDRLAKYAEELHISGVVKRYMEVLL